MRGARRVLLFPTGLLGAAAVVLPAVASSQAAPSIEAVDESGVYGSYHHWKPPSATVAAGGVVSFSNPSGTVNHGVEWRPGNPSAPSCSGVPGASTGQASFGTSWSGTCAFSQPGKYEFWCTVHRQEMGGTITVNAGGTITTTTTTTETGTQTTTSGGGSATSPGASGPQAGSGASGSPLAGSASRAVKLLASQRGRSVRGSVTISRAGEGGSLEVDLLAKSVSLASGGHATRVRVGELIVADLRAGKAAFAVALNGRARGALRRHRRLALSARIVVKPVSGPVVTVTRSVVLHA